MRDQWSIARRAFEAARQATLNRTFAEFKARAAAAKTVDDMWSTLDALEERRRELDELLDYRYSRLTLVFGWLIQEGYLGEDQLKGLSQDKLDGIRRFLSMARNS